ncbi:hypothetical protein [Emticicia sp. 17c]|uniref:hypothetical protein n=1 Tax=Emticicia sp. 17c TaxID=3127704 RepID=UPI00301BCBA7
MKKLFTFLTLCLGWQVALCQMRFATPLKSTTKQAIVLIERNNLNIQGYEGTEIRIEIDEPITTPKQADGLKRVAIKGLEDNSKLGLNVTQDDTTLVIREVCNCYNGTYTLYLPNKLNLMVYENFPQHGQRWLVKDMLGNFEASTEFGHISMYNLNGNIKAYSRHGAVNAYLSTARNIYLSSLYGKVCLEIPESIKAELKIRNSEWNDVFTDFQLPMYENNKNVLTASLNGGGSNTIELRSDHGNIYLRKKK